MRTRQEIKEHAKQAFAAQRGESILAIFLPMLIPFGFGLITSIMGIALQYQLIPNPSNSQYLANVLMFSSVISLVSIAVSLFMTILAVNIDGTFVKVYYGQQISYSEPFSTLKFNTGRKLGGMLWAGLWLYLWTLVGIVSLFIPTIIKALSYSMTPYILASNPNVTATEALRLSKRMTKGHRGKIFVMYLSFIGWQMLSGLTAGILGILYVNPYMLTSFAGLFVELRGYAVSSGVIHPAELDGGTEQYSYNQYPQMPPQYPPMQEQVLPMQQQAPQPPTFEQQPPPPTEQQPPPNQ